MEAWGKVLEFGKFSNISEDNIFRHYRVLFLPLDEVKWARIRTEKLSCISVTAHALERGSTSEAFMRMNKKVGF